MMLRVIAAAAFLTFLVAGLLARLNVLERVSFFRQTSPSPRSSLPIVNGTLFSRMSPAATSTSPAAGKPAKSQASVKSISPSLTRGIVQGPAVLPPANLPEQAIYALLDTAVVQIICSLGDNTFVSGTGIVVSADGIVLTNAHVVEKGTDCSVKTGDPASLAGKFKTVYVADTTAKIPGTDVPREDFAFGKISQLTPNSLLKQPFKFLKLDPSYQPRPDESFYIAAYASEFIGGTGLFSNQQNLVFTIGQLVDFYAVDATSTIPDIIALRGNISTQEGASGSPIISRVDGGVAALVFGQDRGKDERVVVATGERTEFAFLISYLDRVMRKEKGVPLQDFIQRLGIIDSP